MAPVEIPSQRVTGGGGLACSRAPEQMLRASTRQLASQSYSPCKHFPRGRSAAQRRSRGGSVSTSFSVSGHTPPAVSALTVSFEEQFIITDPPSSSWVVDDLDPEFDSTHVSVPDDFLSRRASGGGAESSQSGPSGAPAESSKAARPAIDIGPWLDRRAHIDDKQMVVLRVLKAAINHGSFDIIGHGVPDHVLSHMLSVSMEFFQRPFSDKAELQALGSDLGFRTERCNERGEPSVQHFGAITPIEDPANVTRGVDSTFLMVLEEYAKQMGSLEGELLRLLAEALSLAKGVRLPKDSLVKAKADAGGFMRCSWRDPAADQQPGINDVCSAMSITYSGSSQHVGDAVLRITLGDMMNVWSGGLFENGSAHCTSPIDASAGPISIEHRTAEAGNGSVAVLCGALPELDARA